jgi:hypothetical protein
MMLGAGQILTPVKDTITLGDDHTQLPCWAVAGPLPPERVNDFDTSGFVI